MDKFKKVEMPWLPELDIIVKQLDKMGIDVLINALLYYCETGDTSCAYKILPNYLLEHFNSYKAVLDKYSEEL